MNRRVITAGVVVVIIVVLAALARTRLSKPEAGLQATSDEPSLVAVTTLRVGSSSFTVETASTPAEQSKGLSDRATMDQDRGMVFLFNPPSQPSFWMKGMQFALDFVWIANGKVVEITRNVAPPAANTPVDQLPIYTPRQLVDTVLELNAGASSKLKVGDTVETVTTQIN